MDIYTKSLKYFSTVTTNLENEITKQFFIEFRWLYFSSTFRLMGWVTIRNWWFITTLSRNKYSFRIKKVIRFGFVLHAVIKMMERPWSVVTIVMLGITGTFFYLTKKSSLHLIFNIIYFCYQGLRGNASSTSGKRRLVL